MWAELFRDGGRQAALVAAALGLALALGVPFGVAASAPGTGRSVILGAAALGRTLPSIAVLMLLLPWLGVGAPSAIAALALLALPPIVVNVDLAIRGVSRAVLDAASGLGMNPIQRFARVVVPLALPTSFAGVRTATTEVIASATLATFIGAGGLGDDIVRALQTDDLRLLLSATAVVAAMALFADLTLGRVALLLDRWIA
jgi:osmoprotectant transport system permease protein